MQQLNRKKRKTTTENGEIKLNSQKYVNVTDWLRRECNANMFALVYLLLSKSMLSHFAYEISRIFYLGFLNQEITFNFLCSKRSKKKTGKHLYKSNLWKFTIQAITNVGITLLKTYNVISAVYRASYANERFPLNEWPSVSYDQYSIYFCYNI